MSWYNVVGLGASLLLHVAMFSGGSIFSTSSSAVAFENEVQPATITYVQLVQDVASSSPAVEEAPVFEEPAVTEPSPEEEAVEKTISTPVPAIPTPAPQKKPKTVNRAVTKISSPRSVQTVSSDTSAPQSSLPAQAGAVASGEVASEARPDGLRNAPPEYPFAARRARQEGTVLLLVDVSCEGFATSVRLHRSCGHSLLDEAAKVAVEKWRFRPAITDGSIRASQVVVPVRFVLNNR